MEYQQNEDFGIFLEFCNILIDSFERLQAAINSDIVDQANLSIQFCINNITSVPLNYCTS